jgi:hypothetical protein
LSRQANGSLYGFALLSLAINPLSIVPLPAQGQLEYEWQPLLARLEKRDPVLFERQKSFEHIMINAL